MSYESIVYRILIASPSDVEEEREVAARIIQEWNDLNSFNKKIVLLPIRWETHTSPSYGLRPQEIINNQIVNECDLLIGFFWTKIGSPTGEDISGTIEEIKRVSSEGKPVMLYFSKRGKDPSLIEIEQLTKLNEFKKDIYKVALVENFNSIVDFRDKLSRHLEMKIRELQESNNKNTKPIKFSFIDLKTRKLVSKTLNQKFERVIIKDEVLEAINKSPKVKNREYEFKQALNSFMNKKNQFPLILGIDNITNRILNNSVVHLKITSSNDNLHISSFIPSKNIDNRNSFYQYDLNRENIDSIGKIFNTNLNRLSKNIWEYNTKPFPLLTNKLNYIDLVSLIYPLGKVNIDFTLTLYSDNLLQPIEEKCSINIDYSEREITKEEINETIDNIPDYEYPF
ncbi:hypothetical protein P2W68_12825 [Chryseobacterium arthrosphaerae]|uniref:hypothetical protein n=1 Tax=Chryseobacterium arthrosphaerae TaxID=651561 RepID=UPI0023E18CF4|nr:hypothetical protein [Chryseobacterium arthrosphaerae]WES95742.1 hypothetical protein P2W68_12825 [Chryseobacterium arthrosphaerae]